MTMQSATLSGVCQRLLQGVVHLLGAGSLALLSVSWCLEAVLPPVHYQVVQYRVSSGAKGWEILTGQDAQGRGFKVRYLRSSGAIPESPGQWGTAVELLTSRSPVLGHIVGSDLLAVTRAESLGELGMWERHWELSLEAWWARVLVHVFGGVLCGLIACTLALPYIRQVGALWGRLWRRGQAWQGRALYAAEPTTPSEMLPMHPLLTTSVVWQSTADPFFPYAAQVQDEWWEIRLNDFPAEPMYTLMVEGNARLDFETWPRCWYRPEAA